MNINNYYSLISLENKYVEKKFNLLKYLGDDTKSRSLNADTMMTITSL